MKKIGICGHYSGNKNSLDGQTVKTKIITDILKKKFGKNNIETIDTYGGLRKIFIILFQLWQMTLHSTNIIILPAHNALRVVAPFLAFINMFYKRRLHYIVIGGWLPEFVSKRFYLKKCLKKFDNIYVETSTMKNALEKQGFENVIIMPNFKDLQTLKEEELMYPQGVPFKLCTLSRVTEQKGIEDAINAVCEVNRKFGKVVYSLDIYGQVGPDYKDRFEAIKKSFPEYISYKGCVDFDKTVQVLKNYFALLFPTKHYTEGIPGTIIDAYAAGIPVISTKWESFSDVVDDGITGVGCEFNNYEDFIKTLALYVLIQQPLIDMKKNALKKSLMYTPENGIKKLVDRLK